MLKVAQPRLKEDSGSVGRRPRNADRATLQSERIAVFLPTWVGDLVMATPTLRALRQGLPNGKLIGVCRGVGDELLAGTPWLDEIVTYRRSWVGKNSMTSCIRQLRRLKCSTAILLSNSLTTAAMSWSAGCRRRIGFVRHARRMLLTDPLYAPRGAQGFLPRSATEHYLETLTPVFHGRQSSQICEGQRQVELATTNQERSRCEQVWRSLGLAEHQNVVVLNTGGAYGSAKRWPDSKFTELAQRLANEAVAVLVNCGPAERESAARIVTLANHPHVVSLAGEELAIGLTKAAIQRAQLLISNDSGPRHIGAAFQVPTIALFGPTDPRWSDNGNSQEVRLWVAMDCQPCGRRRCPLQHHRCMTDLSVEQVFNAAMTQLSVNSQWAKC
jgi:heptosyltransferase-2